MVASCLNAIMYPYMTAVADIDSPTEIEYIIDIADILANINIVVKFSTGYENHDEFFIEMLPGPINEYICYKE